MKTANYLFDVDPHIEVELVCDGNIWYCKKCPLELASYINIKKLDIDGDEVTVEKIKEIMYNEIAEELERYWKIYCVPSDVGQPRQWLRYRKRLKRILTPVTA